MNAQKTLMSVAAVTYQRMTGECHQPSAGRCGISAQTLRAFHPLDAEDVLSQIERPKIDEYDDYLFIVMHFPVYDDTPGHTVQRGRFSSSAGFLITIHDGRLKPLDNLFAACHDDGIADQHLGRSRKRLPLDARRHGGPQPRDAAQAGRQVATLKSRCSPTTCAASVRSISLIRRDIIALRQVVKPQIAIVSNLERRRAFIRRVGRLLWRHRR
ncbi:MAG: CorA family divalent cation transporter [Caldilineales bacterium]